MASPPPFPHSLLPPPLPPGVLATEQNGYRSEDTVPYESLHDTLERPLDLCMTFIITQLFVSRSLPNLRP